MANTNVNVVQQIKFLLETELDEKSKIQVGKDLKSILEDAVIAFDKSETEKNLKPIVAMINSVLKKADMPIIDEGSITASFEKIANMSADTFQEAFNAAIKNNGGIRLSFNDMKLDDIIESINKVSESIEQLGNHTSNVKKSIEKDIRDINAAIERMGNGENADKSIQDALQYKPKTVKSYNKTGSQSIDELYNEYDSATNWEEKTVALVKYKKEYDSYLEYLKKKKPTEVESFSSGKYGKLYKRIGNDFSSMVGNLENILVVKRQIETGVLDDRQNELVDDRNKPWAREKTLQEVNRTLKGGLKVSSDGGGGDGGKPVEEHPKSELSKREDAVNKSAKNNNNAKNGSKVVVEEPKIGKKYTMLRAVEFTDDGREQKKQAVDTYGAEYWSRGIDTVKSYADDHRNQSYIIKGNIVPKNPLIIDANGFMWNDWENIPQFKELFPGLRELLADRNNIDDDKQKYINEQARAAGFDAVILKNVQDNKNADLDTRAPTTDTIAVLDDSIVKVTGSIRELTETSEILKSKYGQSMLSDIQRYKELIQKGEDISDEEDEEVGALIEKLTANLTKHVYGEQRKYFEKFEDGEISAEDLAEYLISNRDSKKSSKVFEDKPSKTIPDFYEKPHESTTEEHLSLLKQQQEASQKWYQETITRLEKKPENESLVKQLREDQETSAQNFKKLIEFYESQKAETEQTTKSEAGSTKPNENKKQPKTQESTKQKQSAEQTDIVIDAETLHTAISGVTDDLAKEQTLGEIKGLLEGLAPKVGDDTSPEQSGDKLNEQNKDTVAIDEASLKTVLEGVTYNVKVVDDADGDADQTSLTTAIESATSDLAKDQTINNAKDAIISAISSGAATTEQKVDKATQQQIKQETGNQEQRFERLNDVASNYEDIEDVEAAIKQFGEVYKQIVLMSDVEYKYIKPNKTGINILSKIASGDFDVSDYSGIEFQRVDKPISTTKNISINTSEITDAIRDNAADTKDLAKEETLGNIGESLNKIIENIKPNSNGENSTTIDGTVNVVSSDGGNQIAQETTLKQILETITQDKTDENVPSDGESNADVKPDDGEYAYNKQQNGQTEDSTVANNQKKIKSYEELVAIVNTYFELKSKLRDINVEYADGIYGENYNPPIFAEMESIESMIENSQLDVSNMDVFNALHEDGVNAESAVKRIAAAIGIEVEQQERLNESMRAGIQVRKSLNQTEEQSLLPDSNKFNKKSFLDDAQKAEVVKLGEEYRVILSLLEKDDEKVSEVAGALRERANAIMDVMYAVRQNDSTPGETYKLLFGGSDEAASAIANSKKKSELVSGFDTKNIDNQNRQAAIDLIYKEVEAEKRLLEEKKAQEEAEKETYKTEFIAQYTKALEKEKSLINEIIELQKELKILKDSNDESKYSDVLRKWSDKRAELQDANDALYSAFIDVKPSDAERYIKELPSTNAPTSKSLITTGAQSNSEENDMNVLLASVNAVTEAVKLKTRAFNTERSAVQLVVEDEVKALDVLENKLISIKQTLEGLMNNVGAGASDLASGLSNVNINVNYPENSKVEFNSTAIEQLVSAINSIPSKQNPVTTTAVGNVPATENTLLIIKAAVAAINNKMGKGTKSGGGGGYKKTTKSDYTGSPFFGEKIKTRDLELGKFVQQLNNAGKNTQKLQDMIRQLQTALQAVNSGESLSVYDQMFRQVKLLVSIDDLQRAPVEKDKISDYKQLIKFAKEYYKLVEKYEKAEDGSNRKRVLGNQKDAIEQFMSDNGIDLGNIVLDDENYNKQLSDLRIKHSNSMTEIDAANKDKSNNKALKEEQAEVKKLIDLYRDLGEEIIKRDYAETKESKDAHQQTINEIAKKIRGNAYYDKVNKQDAISVMQDAIANKSASLRQSREDKAGAQRVRDENKALKEQEQTITKLEAMYKNLGKAMAEIEVNGDLKKKEEASQLQKEIDIKIQGLKLAKDEEDTLREKLNIIKETAKENNKALLVAQNNQKDNKKELNKQVRISRQKARIGRANSTINGAEDIIYNAGVIDSVDASEIAVVQTLKTELEKLKGLYAAIQATDGAVNESDAQQLVNQTRLVKIHTTELNKLLQQYERLSGDNVKEIVSYDAKGNLEKQLINAAKAATNGSVEIKGFNEETGELVTLVKGEKNSFTECTYAVREYDNQIVQVTGTTKKMEGFMDGILRKTKEIFMYFSGSSVVYKLFDELRQGIQYVREIDGALTELKKVTDETDETYEKFLNTASKTAGKVGSTVKDIVSSTADWARLGYSLEDAANLAESTSILLNVSEFQSIDDATSALVSTMQAFGYAAEDSMHVVDVMNEIGKLLPIDNYIG